MVLLLGLEYRKLHSTLGGSTKRFLIDDRGACPRRARDRRVEPSRSAMPLDLHCLQSIR